MHRKTVGRHRRHRRRRSLKEGGGRKNELRRIITGRLNLIFKLFPQKVLNVNFSAHWTDTLVDSWHPSLTIGHRSASTHLPPKAGQLGRILFPRSLNSLIYRMPRPLKISPPPFLTCPVIRRVEKKNFSGRYKYPTASLPPALYPSTKWNSNTITQ